jgi:hypothetical protein
MQVPHLQSNSQEWINWHLWLKKQFGKKEANEVFMLHWGRIGQKSRANDSTLRAYMSSQGVDISGNYGIFSAGSDLLQGAGQGVGQVGKSFKIGVILIAILLIVAVYFFFLK